MGKTIGVISLKGGVGKTSSVVALGHALSGFGKKVLLVDGNFSAPNLGVHLDIVNPDNSVHEVLRGVANPGDAIIDVGAFDVLPANLFNKFDVNFLKLKDKIRHLKRKYDVIILDSSPSLNEETLAVMNASDELLVVTTSDYPTLSMTMKNVRLANQRGAKIVGLILNKVHGKNFEIPLADIEKTVEVPVMAVIPHDLNVLKAVSKFKPSTELKPKSKSSEEYKRLAAALIGEKYKSRPLRKFFRWLNPRKQDINRLIFYEQVFGQ